MGLGASPAIVQAPSGMGHMGLVFVKHDGPVYKSSSTWMGHSRPGLFLGHMGLSERSDIMGLGPSQVVLGWCSPGPVCFLGHMGLAFDQA